MKMVGTLRFALLPGVEPAVFERHMREEVFTSGLKLTAITREFHHELLRSSVRRPGDPVFSDPEPGIQYVWQATVDLQTDSGYDFGENTASIQDRVDGRAVLVGIDSYVLTGG